MAANALTIAKATGAQFLSEREETTIAVISTNTTAFRGLFERMSEQPGIVKATARIGSTTRSIELAISDTNAIPSWLKPTLTHAIQLMLLPPNWDLEGGLPIQRASVGAALQGLSMLMTERSSLPQWIPTSEGGVQLEWHEANLDLEIEFSADGTAAQVVFGDLLDDHLDWHGALAANLERLKRLFEDRLLRDA